MLDKHQVFWTPDGHRDSGYAICGQMSLPIRLSSFFQRLEIPVAEVTFINGRVALLKMMLLGVLRNLSLRQHIFPERVRSTLVLILPY